MRLVANWTVSLRNWIYFLFSLALGLGAGAFSAQYAVRQGAAAPAVIIGPWQSYTETGGSELNPYALAYTSIYGSLKLENFEVLYFVAKNDGENTTLSGDCEYVIKGKIPDAKWWSLTVYDQNGLLIDNPAERYSFNGTNVLLKEKKEFTIALAARARAGNWIPIEAGKPFVIMLRLYSPGINSIRDANEISFPEVERLNCS